MLLCLATRAGLWILSHRTDVGSTCIDIRNASCMLLIAFSYLVHSVDLLVSSYLYYFKLEVLSYSPQRSSASESG